LFWFADEQLEHVPGARRNPNGGTIMNRQGILPLGGVLLGISLLLALAAYQSYQANVDRLNALQEIEASGFLKEMYTFPEGGLQLPRAELGTAGWAYLAIAAVCALAGIGLVGFHFWRRPSNR
jgi:hypothetical protein